jgi:hypothetical protein
VLCFSYPPAFFYSVKLRQAHRKVLHSYRFQIPLQVLSFCLGPVLGWPIGKYDEFLKLLFWILKVCDKGMAVKSPYCLNSCLPSGDSTPKVMVLLWDPVTVTMGLLSFIIHFLHFVMIGLCVKMASSRTSTFQSFLRWVSIPLCFFKDVFLFPGGSYDKPFLRTLDLKPLCGAVCRCTSWCLTGSLLD